MVPLLKKYQSWRFLYCSKSSSWPHQKKKKSASWCSLSHLILLIGH